MAKASKVKKESGKKALKKKTIVGLTKELQPLEGILGKKKFAKRVKKSAKIMTEGLKVKEVKKPKAVKPTAAKAKKETPAKPATKPESPVSVN